jgi:hypothetical protein
MKRNLCIPLVTLALAGGYGAQQEAQESELKAKVEALELQVEELSELASRVESIETYLKANARAMESYGSAVDEAVSKGFATGENYPSRQVLVQAWKAQVRAATTQVPGPKPKPTEHVDPRLRRRQEIEKLRGGKR